jgi:methyl-accepting chemotaxis protein
MALLSAATAIIGIILAAVLIRDATSSGFGLYLQHAAGMGGMMGGVQNPLMGINENAFLTSVNRSLWAAGVIGAALSALIAIVFSRQITAPLRRLSTASARVAGGDLSCRLPAGSNNEIGILSNSFNCMVESLSENQESRRKLMGDLAH